MSGSIDIGSNALTLANADATGSGRILSNGGKLSVLAGTTLSRLTVDGAVTLMTAVNSTGDQTYNGSVTFLSSGSPYIPATATAPAVDAVANFSSSAGNISFMSTLSAGSDSKGSQRNLVVSAQNGTVLFNDQVGRSLVNSAAATYQTIDFINAYQTNLTDESPYALNVNAQTIRLYGDVTTFETQKYSGAVLIGDNTRNGNNRLLVSIDPSITFIGTVDDATAGQHALILRAINLPQQTGAPAITIGEVGQTSALASLNALVGVQWNDATALVADINPDRTTYVGELNITGSVKTTNDQLYVGGLISLANSVTMRSDLGSIEMITGMTPQGPQPISGLNQTTFSFGPNAPGVGTELLAQAVTQNVILNISTDPVPPTPVPPTPVPPTPVQPSQNHTSPVGNYRAMATPTLEMSAFERSTTVTDVGDVSVGELTDVDCDPKADDSCRVK
jgi:hypothetical protein